MLAQARGEPQGCPAAIQARYFRDGDGAELSAGTVVRLLVFRACGFPGGDLAEPQRSPERLHRLFPADRVLVLSAGDMRHQSARAKPPAGPAGDVGGQHLDGGHRPGALSPAAAALRKARQAPTIKSATLRSSARHFTSLLPNLRERDSWPDSIRECARPLSSCSYRRKIADSYPVKGGR
jgi:hypothetical protein